MRVAWLRKAFLIALLVAISLAFLAMVRMFLLTLALAAIAAGLVRPCYLGLQRRLHGHRRLAAALTTALVLVAIVLPLVLLGGAVAREATSVAVRVQPWMEAQLERIDASRFPFITPAADLAGSLGAWLATALATTLSTATKNTLLFVFHFFILLYALFFFLLDGPRMLRSVLAYVPLAAADKARMLDRFMSVAHATLKGTVLVGAVQGALSGLAFWAVGIDGAIFWTATMMVLSILPGIGGALVWVPAVVMLAAQGAVWQAIGVALYCAIVVGSVDNVMRPWLVGRDTRMPNLLVLISTLSGLVVFGFSGFVVGPILAALFLTVWEMFGAAFRDELRGRMSRPRRLRGLAPGARARTRPTPRHGSHARAAHAARGRSSRPATVR